MIKRFKLFTSCCYIMLFQCQQLAIQQNGQLVIDIGQCGNTREIDNLFLS